MAIDAIDIIRKSGESLGAIVSKYRSPFPPTSKLAMLKYLHSEIKNSLIVDSLCKSMGYSNLIWDNVEECFPMVAEYDGFSQKIKQDVLYWYELRKKGVLFDDIEYFFDCNGRIYKASALQ